MWARSLQISGSNTRMPNRQPVGEVAKRSNAADCKSVALAASKVRVLPSPPSSARDDRERDVAQEDELRLASQPELVASQSKFGSSAGSRGEAGPARRIGETREHVRRVGGSNSVVESQPSKLLVAGSIPVSRSSLRARESRASYGWQASLPFKGGGRTKER